MFRGGPVQRNQVVMVLNVPKAPPPARQIIPELFASSALATAQWASRTIAPNRIRAHYGYAGWGPGQLDSEIAAEAWHLVAADPASMFEVPPAQLWERLIDLGGGKWVGPRPGPAHPAGPEGTDQPRQRLIGMPWPPPAERAGTGADS